MPRYTFRVGEVEHSDDAAYALRQIAKAGCKNVVLVEASYAAGDGDDESIVVAADFDGDKTALRTALHAAEVCV